MPEHKPKRRKASEVFRIFAGCFILTSLVSCSVLGWLAQPMTSGSVQAGACQCQGQGKPIAAQVGTKTRGDAAIDTVTSVGGTVTGNPFAWAVVGQVMHLVWGAFRPRTRKTGSAAA